jgi:hypothetical protein
MTESSQVTRKATVAIAAIVALAASAFLLFDLARTRNPPTNSADAQVTSDRSSGRNSSAIRKTSTTYGAGSAAGSTDPDSLNQSPRTTTAVDTSITADYIRARPSEPWDLVAFSAAEAEWLRQRGYPLPEEWVKRKSLSYSELDRRIAAGDIAAYVYKAERLYSERSPASSRQADWLLEEAILRGNGVALQMQAVLRSEFSEGVGTTTMGGKDPTSSISVLEPLLLASMMGDYRAAEAIEQFSFVGPLATWLPRALTLASSRLARINAERARRGWPPLDLNPRPGAEQWHRAFNAGASLTPRTR